MDAVTRIAMSRYDALGQNTNGDVRHGELRKATEEEFLTSLSKEERKLIYRGDEFSKAVDGIDKVFEEEGENMSVDPEPYFKKDLIGDNSEMKLWHFPPADAPEELIEAWDEMKKSMTMEEQMCFIFHLMPLDPPIHGHNFARDGYPKSIDGWTEVLGDVYDSLSDGLKFQSDHRVVQNQKKAMEYLQEFIKRLEAES